MNSRIVYVDRSRVREGALAQLKQAIAELAAFVEANEPRILSYDVYFDEDGRRMTVIHSHPDAASLDHHMRVAGAAFKRFVDLVELISIDVYGELPPEAMERLHEKARLLGGEVTAHAHHAGLEIE